MTGKTLSPALRGLAFGWIHLVTEVACFYWLYAFTEDSPYWWTYALLYDALAFVPQSFIGILTDRFRRIPAAPIGLGLMGAMLLIPFPALGLVPLTLGNGLVHVAGAQTTLREAKGKLFPSGLFVAGGSFGVISGRLMAQAGLSVLIPLILLASGLALSFLPGLLFPQGEAEGFSGDRPIPDLPFTALVFLTVAARSYIGYAIPTSWIQSVPQTVLLFVCMGLGKAAGGWFCDRFGLRRTAVVSLLGALPFLCFGDRIMWVSLLGVALFSMTMTPSLGLLAARYPDRPGFAFGITTVALFAGSLPAFFVRPETLAAHILTVCILTLVAVGCFALTASGKEKTGFRSEHSLQGGTRHA